MWRPSRGRCFHGPALAILLIALARSAMWKLVIEDDEGKRTVVPLTRDDYTIGRQEGNTVRLTERNVSRSHSRVRRTRANGATKEGFLVEDCQSYNGVFVNGLRVAHTQDLQHGDLIQIGDYRLILQDDAASAIETAAIPVTTMDVEPGHVAPKMTAPMAASFRGQTLTERPNRLVMLVGPTPGVEYPLEHDRMTIGRAEDSSISVNHNSVSRLHCEIHSLGDGRFEVVDKGSSNGVRVNGVELRRTLIEPGDVIELGDVRFKFVGAGQVFVPGPNESQQLTAISDREAELVDHSRRGWAGYVVPIMAAGLVGAALILGIVWYLRTRTTELPTNGGITAQSDVEQALLLEAKNSCTIDDCEAPYQKVSTELAPKSLWRDSPDFHNVVQTWADSVLKKAQAEADPTARRALLQRVAGDANVDAFRRKQATDQIALLDEPTPTPTQLPAATKDAGTTVTSAVVAPPPTPPTPRPTTHPPTSTTSAAVEKPPAPPRPSGGGDVSSIAGPMIISGQYAQAKALLEPRIRSGHATEFEQRQYKQACKGLQDPTCK
jgi:pSer/pThr/pTyr-binding forkhead associated (FHA) protein